jgi:hypothetical protein
MVGRVDSRRHLAKVGESVVKRIPIPMVDNQPCATHPAYLPDKGLLLVDRTTPRATDREPEWALDRRLLGRIRRYRYLGYKQAIPP